METKTVLEESMDIDRFKEFIRTLSYREFLTAFTLSIFTICLQYIRYFYWEVELIKSMNNFGFNFLVFSTIIMLNHVFYKLEHKRSNSYYIRTLIDFTFLIIYVVLRHYLFHEISINWTSIIIGFFYILLLEMVFSTLKLLKCKFI